VTPFAGRQRHIETIIWGQEQSLEAGGAACETCCHSFIGTMTIGTMTAISAPRLVTNRGSSVRQASSNSLNRALAS
jgi:hypothetical protein